MNMPKREPSSLAERIARLDPADRERTLAALSPEELEQAQFIWTVWEREDQREPNLPWRTWLVLAGRGFGKTRMGAEWVRRTAAANPGAHIALVGATIGQARSVMVEGDSGILGVCPDHERPEWQPSLGRLRWRNGARAQIYSAAEPESLRGPQHHFAWCDEIAKWPFGPAAWDNLMLGLRCGALPRAVATTTPRPVQLVRKLYLQEGVARSRGRTGDNEANLAPGFIDDVRRDYGGTRLGRQELDGELIEDVEGSLWPRALIEASRCRPPRDRHGDREQDQAGGDSGGSAPGRHLFRRVVIGVDPPVTAAGRCGIIVCALGHDGIAYVLADCSVTGVSPDGWAQAVAQAGEAWGADRVAAERNQGGNMIDTVLRTGDVAMPVKLVHAWDGKSARAEPVAALFERGAARLAGAFPELEDELAGMIVGGDYEGPGRSPDRADAMVWALTELMLRRKRPQPRIRSL
jgi:phage terminase large subunit-like protein